MNIKKAILQVTTISLLLLNVAKINELIEVSQSQLTSSDTEVISEMKNMNEQDVYDMEHINDEYVTYRPLKAFKAEYKGVEYFYLNDNEGSMYISFENLVDGGNYIGEVGKYTDTLYELEYDKFQFSDDYEKSYEDYSIMDSKVAEKMISEMMIEL